MELGAGAGRLGHDRVGGGVEPVDVADAGDLDRDVLAASVEDLLAEQLVARVGADAVRGHVVRGQRRQDPDHHQVRADLGRLGLGAVEVAAQQLLELLEPALTELDRRHVDLDVEQAELGLEGGVGDGRQRLGVLQRRVAVLVDQVELDLEPGHRVVGVEPRLAQHPGEHVETAPDLLAVARPVGPGELLCLHLFAHVRTLGPIGGVRGGPRGSRCGRGRRRRHPPASRSVRTPPAAGSRPLPPSTRSTPASTRSRSPAASQPAPTTQLDQRDEHLPGRPQACAGGVEQAVGQPVARRPPPAARSSSARQVGQRPRRPVRRPRSPPGPRTRAVSSPTSSGSVTASQTRTSSVGLARDRRASK